MTYTIEHLNKIIVPGIPSVYYELRDALAKLERVGALPDKWRKTRGNLGLSGEECCANELDAIMETNNE